MTDQLKMRLKNYLSRKLQEGYSFKPKNPNKISEDETNYIAGMTTVRNQIFELIDSYSEGSDTPKAEPIKFPYWVENTTKYQRAKYESKKGTEEDIKQIYISLGGKLTAVALEEINQKKKMEEEKIEEVTPEAIPEMETPSEIEEVVAPEVETVPIEEMIPTSSEDVAL